MKNLDSILQTSDITLLTKVHIVKDMVFPVVMYRCESWTIKNAEYWKMDTFELWCWRRLLRVPLDCKEIKSSKPKGNQLWIFIGRTVAEAEALILWPTDAKSWLTGKDPDAGKDWRKKRKGGSRGLGGYVASLTQLTWIWANSGRWWRAGEPGVLQSLGSQGIRHNLVTEQQEDNIY